MAERDTSPEDHDADGASGEERAGAAPFHATRAARLTAAVAAAHLAPVKRTPRRATSANPWIR
ncbi:hypothetical protein [Streptomyces sp. S186]|uniref:hypothetical protein n=1 Tax=Streptomyces sp. S186 TaxID=3434395 RepID=UPI003F66730A